MFLTFWFKVLKKIVFSDLYLITISQSMCRTSQKTYTKEYVYMAAKNEELLIIFLSPLKIFPSFCLFFVTFCARIWTSFVNLHNLITGVAEKILLIVDCVSPRQRFECCKRKRNRCWNCINTTTVKKLEKSTRYWKKLGE
jgi:hypothetical protein